MTVWPQPSNIIKLLLMPQIYGFLLNPKYIDPIVLYVWRGGGWLIPPSSSKNSAPVNRREPKYNIKPTFHYVLT